MTVCLKYIESISDKRQTANDKIERKTLACNLVMKRSEQIFEVHSNKSVIFRLKKRKKKQQIREFYLLRRQQQQQQKIDFSEAKQNKNGKQRTK